MLVHYCMHEVNLFTKLCCVYVQVQDIMMSMSSIIGDKIHSSMRVVNLSKQVLKVEMSPFEWSHNLICIAHTDEIIIGMVRFQVMFL